MNLEAPRNAVQECLAEFARKLESSRVPKYLLGGTYIYYHPINNTISIPLCYVMELSSRSLRIVIAHEYGHFLRRWKLFFARTDERRMAEEILADRMAWILTGASVQEFEDTMRKTAQLEGDILDYDEHEALLAFRSRMLTRFMAKDGTGLSWQKL